MTATEEFGFQADPAPMAFSLMRSIWTDRPDVSVEERIEFIRALMEDTESGTSDLAEWMRSAVQD
ncbi:hypothetical protein [Nocardioides sp. Leaf285]|uniref:hypothetical protein n=1 Tax=Nocardioides sp. Leaf285 TaxID=1736322 RepID=UPI000702C1EC|nr:hypothetical protein [Nocardioides sp. Leaf285]KQP63771.1 hypothetical protein ASF47_17495 [Nocardioides sp. Leaf285]